MDEEKRGKGKTLWLKIIVPLLLLLLIFVVWAIKHAEEPPSAVIPADPDFALAIKAKIDLERLTSYGLPVIIEFGSDSCPACRQLAPIIRELNAELQGKAIIRYADVWADPALAEGFPLNVIPTQLFITADGRPYAPAQPEDLDLIIYHSPADGKHLYTLHEGLLTKQELLKILAEMGMK